MYTPKSNHAMERRKRLLGFGLIVLASAWLCFDQIMLLMAPVAMASEAPYRHLHGREKFTGDDDAFAFSFALAKDINKRLPNVLLPLVPMLAGVWLLSRSATSEAFRNTSDESTPTI
jgi:hypothetical protein